MRSDVKRPDGVMTVPWKCGKQLVWNTTCPDTNASSYVSQATIAVGEVAALAEQSKSTKYDALPVTHSLTPIAIEMSGAVGPRSLGFFLCELERQMS